MCCCCAYCAGSGFWSNLLSIIVSVTFSFHLVGILSPYWMWMCEEKEVQECKIHGLYFSCDGTCSGYVRDKDLLTLAVIVLVSSLTLSLVFCLILHCSQFRYQKMSPTLALAVGGWYTAQQILNTGLLIALAVKYTRLGWSAYVFTVPGIIMLALVIMLLVYMWCCPENTVHPDN